MIKILIKKKGREKTDRTVCREIKTSSDSPGRTEERGAESLDGSYEKIKRKEKTSGN